MSQRCAEADIHLLREKKKAARLRRPLCHSLRRSVAMTIMIDLGQHCSLDLLEPPHFKDWEVVHTARAKSSASQQKDRRSITAVFLFGLIQARQRLLDQTLPTQAGMRKTDAAEVFRGLAVGLRLPELRSLNEDYYSAACFCRARQCAL